MNQSPLLLVSLFAAPVASILLVTILAKGKLTNDITVGLGGFAVYWVIGKVVAYFAGPSPWVIVAGLAGALVLGLILRGRRLRNAAPGPQQAPPPAP